MRAVLEIVAWWLVLTGVWLTTLNAYSSQELAAATLLALPCAFAARAGRRAASIAWRVRPGWARWLLRLPGAIVGDTIGLLRMALGRHAVGEGDEFRELPLPREQDPALRRGREAVATALLSASPGSVVVDADESHDRLLVHAVPVRVTKLERELRR